MTLDPEPPNVTGIRPVQDPADHSVDDIAAIKSDAVTLANAKKATENEHNMSVWDCVKLYPKTIGWSVVISTCIVMEAYDVSLLSNFYAFAQFNEKYGQQLPDGSYQVSAPWQAALSNGVNVGEIIGLLLNGLISERIGYR